MACLNLYRLMEGNESVRETVFSFTIQLTRQLLIRFQTGLFLFSINILGEGERERVEDSLLPNEYVYTRYAAS